MKGTRAAALMMLGAILAACARPDGSWPASASGTLTAAPTSTAARDLRGEHVDVIGLWSGPEFDSFEAVASAWEDETGAVVDWEWTDDLPGAIANRLQAGDPPAVAVLPSLAMMNGLARDGTLIPLDSVLDMTAIRRDYAPAWIELGSHQGKLYGLFYKVTDKAVVWYNPTAFDAAGYALPRTWDEMTALADTIVADGANPFSVVAPRGPAAGWALTDWISVIVLNSCGPDLYDRWIAAEIRWDHDCIRQSFEMFIELVSTDGYVLGGTQRIVRTGDDVGADPLYTDPPTAYLYYLASFAQAFIAQNHPDLEPGTGYDVMRFPTINPEYAGAVTIGADVPVLLSDTPAARSLMTYLAGPRSQETWIERGGFTSVNSRVSAETYPDPVARGVAERLATAEIVRFSAGDMMPPRLQRAWWAAMLDLVEDPGQLDAILERLTAVAQAER